MGQPLVGKSYSSGITLSEGFLYNPNFTAPMVILTDTDSDNLVSNSDVVTITATFSERMAASPTLNLSGIISNATMSATPSDTVWTYTWTVSSTVTSSTATVSGTDLAGNAYSGTDSITFIIDNTAPTVSLTDTDSDNLVSNSDVVTITATFSESMSATPTLNLSGIISDALMSATSSDSVWTYTWTVSGSTVTSTTLTVSGTDLSGNGYSGTNSITFTIDNSYPTLESFTDNDTDNIVNNSTNVTLTATFSEPMIASPTISISGLVTNTAMTVSASTNSNTSSEIFTQIMITSSNEILSDISNNQAPKYSKIFLGCAVWDYNQLNNEILENSWIITNSSEEIIFDGNSGFDLWKKSLLNIGIDPKKLVSYSGTA